MTTHTSRDDSLELTIGGMTCASCAARIEKKLNRLDGVTATVNYATEKAKVSFPATVTAADLVATVEATGYTATLPQPVGAAGDAFAQAAGEKRRLDDVDALVADRVAGRDDAHLDAPPGRGDQRVDRQFLGHEI